MPTRLSTIPYCIPIHKFVLGRATLKIVVENWCKFLKFPHKALLDVFILSFLLMQHSYVIHTTQAYIPHTSLTYNGYRSKFFRNGVYGGNSRFSSERSCSIGTAQCFSKYTVIIFCDLYAFRTAHEKCVFQYILRCLTQATNNQQLMNTRN